MGPHEEIIGGWEHVIRNQKNRVPVFRFRVVWSCAHEHVLQFNGYFGFRVLLHLLLLLLAVAQVVSCPARKHLKSGKRDATTKIRNEKIEENKHHGNMNKWKEMGNSNF